MNVCWAGHFSSGFTKFGVGTTLWTSCRSRDRISGDKKFSPSRLYSWCYCFCPGPGVAPPPRRQQTRPRLTSRTWVTWARRRGDQGRANTSAYCVFCDSSNLYHNFLARPARGRSRRWRRAARWWSRPRKPEPGGNNGGVEKHKNIFVI